MLSAIRDKRRLPAWLLSTSVILGMIAYALVVGLLVEDHRDRLTLLLLALPALGITGLFLMEYRYFQLAVLILPITALAVPLSFPTGTESRVPISLALVLLLVGVWCASMYRRGWKLAPSPLNRPLLIFGVIAVVSLIWGIIWRDPILVEHPTFIVTQIAALATFLMSIGAALLVGNFVQTPGQLKYMLGVFLFFLSLMALARSFDLPLVFLNGGGLWGLWLVAILYGLILVQPGIRWYWRGLLLLLLAATLRYLLIHGSFWLSGWVPALVAIYAVTWLHSRRALLVLVIAGLLLYQTAPVKDFLHQVNQENIAEGSSNRLILWQRSFELIREHWLLGMGPAGYALYNDSYYPDEIRSSHNNYIDIVAQFGLIGTLAWLWLMYASVREGWRLIRHAPPGFLRTLAVIATGGWIGALSSMVFGDWVLPFAYNITITGYSFTVYSWIFLGMLISLRRHVRLEGW